MCGIINNIREIQHIFTLAEQYEANARRMSEIDTQALLVEPILCFAGYDIYNPCIIKRASRGWRNQEFDIEVYKNGKLFLAIEVKSLSSDEFNINKIKNGIGALSKINGKWENKDKDGVGQLRAYFLNWNNKINDDTIPILTNGKEWVLFKMKFIKNPTRSVESCMLLGRANITDKNAFYKDIISKIKNT